MHKRDSNHIATPEVLLAICCARVNLSEANARQLDALLQTSIDWQLVSEYAKHHGLLPLLHRHLCTHDDKLVPRDFKQMLSNHYQQNAIRNVYLTGELTRLLNVFTQHEIAVLPFKGPALARAAYGDVGLREFGDLDILVERHAVFAAKEILVAHGFIPASDLDAKQQNLLLKSEYHWSFFRQTDCCLIELHWQIVPRYFGIEVDIKTLWQQGETINLQGDPTQVLSVEDCLFALCVHGAKHLWSKLAWVCDIAELLRTRPDIDWTKTLALAEHHNSLRLLLHGLSLAADLLDAPLPAQIQEAINRDKIIAKIVMEVRSNIHTAHVPPPSSFLMFAFHVRSRERIRDKLNYCVRVALVPSIADQESQTSISKTFPVLRYLRRPFRLVKTYAKHFRRKDKRARTEL